MNGAGAAAVLLAASGRPGGVGLGTAVGAAWRQQLEKAQATGWFRRSDGLAGGTSQREPQAVPMGIRALQRFSPTPGLNSARTIERGGVANATQGGLQSHGAQAGVASATAARTGASAPDLRTASTANALPAFPTPGAGHAADAPDLTPARVARPVFGRRFQPEPRAPAGAMNPPGRPKGESRSAAGAEGSPVSVHVQHDQRGAQVWLGIPGQPHEVAGLAQAMLPALRRELALAGVPLQRVVCNGALVYAAEGDGDSETL